YAETCAAIGSVYWNYRMFLLHGDSKYMDILERTLYNGLISGVGLDGKSFFYTNAMQIWNHHTHQDMEPVRSGWFPCSCCPTNVARLLPSVPGYMYAVKDRNVYVNLYINGNANIALNAQQKVAITQESGYPFAGDIKLRLNTARPAAFALLLRIPGWARGEAIPGGLYRFTGGAGAEPVKILVNGQAVDVQIEKGYAVINRTWKKNDSVELVLPMSVQTVIASDSVKEDIGKVAIQRGPIVYCAEWVDNQNRTGNLLLPRGSGFIVRFEPTLLNGIATVSTSGRRVEVDPSGLQVSTKETSIVAIPYYAWANRGKGEMNIWFPEKLTDVDLLSR
ncbi:MAG TPA: beta-L-arabinofuranosidase domain-containing protein, partial [Puia sp.]